MLTTTMDSPPRDQTSEPFQARALHFLKNLALRGRTSVRKSKVAVSPVAIPTQDFHRTHSSVDLLRKPDIPQAIGFRAEDGPNPMDTNDSFQDASPSVNLPNIRPRRHSTWDTLSTPVQSTFTTHAAPPLFLCHQAGLANQFSADPENLFAPAPLLLQSNTPLDAAMQPARCSELGPEIPPHIKKDTPESKPDREVVQDALNNDMPRPQAHVRLHNDTLPDRLNDLAPLTSSISRVLSRTKSLPTPDKSTSETIEERPALLAYSGASSPLPFRHTTERGLRLSPSIITRHPMPFLNLPALPPQPPVPDTPSRQGVPLRSMPSLSRHGRSDGITEQPDHEDATLGDSDEEDEGDEEEFIDASSIHQSDDDDDDDEPSFAGPSGNRGLVGSQKHPTRDDESLAESTISPALSRSDFVDPDLADHFCSETDVQSLRVEPSSTLAIYPFSPNVYDAEDCNQRHVLDSDLSTPGTRLENTPSLRGVASRSMINVGSTRRTERSFRSRETMVSNPASDSGPFNELHDESEESDTEAAIGRLLRRTSMPSFHPTSDPPPYPTFDPRPKGNRIASCEDEGREWLPPYSNSLYLIAIMPRKMEFSSPGVQAKDRKWRRVVCELEGTTFRVYKCPPGASGAGVLGDWWEKHVGVGDMAGPNPPRTRKKGQEEQSQRPPKLGVDESSEPVTSARSACVPPARRRTGSQSSMMTQPTTMSTPIQVKRVSAASFLSPFRNSSSTRAETTAGESSRAGSREVELLDVQDGRSSHESTGRATPAAQPQQPRSGPRLTFLPVATGRTQSRNGETLKPPRSDLLRAYTLQNAESGLGNDYLKRKNVIRVRLEGEQFLLQAQDTPGVVEWIEGLHAGTNIALDLDQRAMPRGPMFPRRRRRRPRRTQEGTSGERPSAGS